MVSSNNFFSSDQWISDFTFLYQEIIKTFPDPFHKVPENVWNLFLEDLTLKANLRNDFDFFGKLLEFTSFLHCGHSKVYPVFETKTNLLLRLPIRLNLDNKGLYILGIEPERKQLLGKRVEKVNGYEIKSLIDKLKPFIASENKMGLFAWVPAYLTFYVTLFSIEVVSAVTEAVIFTIKDEFGQELNEEVPFKPHTIVDLILLTKQPSVLSDFKEIESKPLFYYDFDDLAFFYIRLSMIGDSDEISFSEFITEIFKKIDELQVEKIIIDLRNNGGGDNYLNFQIIENIIKRHSINKLGNIFVLINRHTFSAAVNLCIDLELLTWALFVGEPFSAKINHYGDAKVITLPNTNIPALVATLYWQNGDPQDTREYIYPDIPIYEDKDSFNKTNYEEIRSIIQIINKLTFEHESEIPYPNYRWKRASQKNNWLFAFEN